MTGAEPGLNVLALNSGSSSLKFGLYLVRSSRTEMLISGEAQSIGDEKGKFYARDSRDNALLSETVSIPSQREAIVRIGRLLADSKMPAPAAIGHRIVHGGPKLRQHCFIDDLVVSQLEAATAFAPLHIPSALSLPYYSLFISTNNPFALDLFSLCEGDTLGGDFSSSSAMVAMCWLTIGSSTSS